MSPGSADFENYKHKINLMADELAEFYREILKLIAQLHSTHQISNDHRQKLKKILMEDEEFCMLLM